MPELLIMVKSPDLSMILIHIEEVATNYQPLSELDLNQPVKALPLRKLYM
jgi:hypothetical protein